jgi:hypothetical protein
LTLQAAPAKAGECRAIRRSRGYGSETVERPRQKTSAAEMLAGLASTLAGRRRTRRGDSELARLNAELERLRAILRQHGIQPGDDAA